MAMTRPSFLQVLLAVLACYLAVAIAGCAGVTNRPEGASARAPKGYGAGETAESFAREVLDLIAERRIEAVADRVHPGKGVLFSPYGYIDRNTAINLTGRQLIEAWRLNRSFTWGVEDGSGEPIVRTIKGFFDEFVYGVDYRNADQVSVGKPLGQGNSVINIHTVFPDAEFVEFYFAGFSPEFGGLDWRSLRIVLEKNAEVDGWWLVAIVNDQWTI
jgi:hypothetical protein